MHSNVNACNGVVMHHNHARGFCAKRLSILKITNMAEVRNSESNALEVSYSLHVYIALLELYVCERLVLMCTSNLYSL